MTESVGKYQKLKVLFISQRFLFPMNTGGKIRTGKILEELKKVFDITLVSNLEPLKDEPYLHHMKDLCEEFHSVIWKEIPRGSLHFYFKILIGSFSRYPISVLNDYSSSFEWKIQEVFKEKPFDLVICDFLQSSLNLSKISGCPLLLFEHNVESILVRRHYEVSKNLISKLFWWLQWIKMDHFEKKMCQRFNGVVTVSEVDRTHLIEKYSAPKVYAIPTGVDFDYFSPLDGPIEENTLVFTGSMDWLPNEDAILFFAHEILGEIKKQGSDIRLKVVGRNPSKKLVHELNMFPEIEVLGWVEDVRPFISRSAVYVIPLRIGGGTRIKAYEAMAMGKAIVSTSIGLEGLPVENGKNVILADTAESFSREVVNLLRDPLTRKKFEISAREFVQRNCSWGNAAKAFEGICENVVSENAGERG